MKIEVGKEYKTRGGRTYAAAYRASNNGHNSILAVNTSDHALIWLSDDGKYNRSGKDSEHDLISEAPKKIKVEGWVNVYPEQFDFNTLYSDKKLADHFAANNRIACKRIEFEIEFEVEEVEGQSLAKMEA